MTQSRNDGLARLIADMCIGVDNGAIPRELVRRFVENPWALLAPNEVFGAQYGDLIPKNVDLTTVCKATSSFHGRAIFVGVRENGQFWSSDGMMMGPPSKEIRPLNPFLFVNNEPKYVVCRDGSVWNIDGSLMGRKLVNEHPPMIWKKGMWSLWLEEHVFESQKAPDGIVLGDGVLCAWSQTGDVYVTTGRSVDKDLSLRVNCGSKQTVHAVAMQGDMTVLVVRWEDEMSAYFSVLILRDQRIVMNTVRKSPISMPRICGDGTVLVRMDDSRMKWSPGERVWELLGPIPQDADVAQEKANSNRDSGIQSVVMPHGISAVTTQRQGDGKQWNVVMDDGHGCLTQIGKSANAIFDLRMEKNCLRWYAREGRAIIDCRMVIENGK